MSALHRPQKEVLEACSLIRSLNPKPGSSFGDRHYMPYIRPELVIIRFDGYFDILLNDSSIPALRMNSYYLELLKEGKTEDTARYLRKKKKNWNRFSLVSAIGSVLCFLLGS